MSHMTEGWGVCAGPDHQERRYLVGDGLCAPCFRAQLVANCDAPPESDAYDRAQHALQDFDEALLGAAPAPETHKP